MKDSLRISEELRAEEPGMVDVIIDVDARFATVETSEGRTRLRMRLPREAWPGALGLARAAR